MNLSENFSVTELTVTDTGIYNTPGEFELQNLLLLATYILQPIRDRWGRIRINSGFRSKQVQEALKKAGAPVAKSISDHELGRAADFFPRDEQIGTVFEWCKTNLKYGQIILEVHGGATWIHIALPRIAKQNQHAMTYDGHIYQNV
jgi:hypothetical protein